MGLNDNIYKDVKEALVDMESQTYSDKVKTLTLLLDKYVQKNRTTHLMNYHDLNAVIDHAKKIMADESFPKFLKLGSITKEVSANALPNLCVIEATIGYINSLDCLKRLPKFDYRENKF